jgi:uncharacterized protein YciI
MFAVEYTYSPATATGRDTHRAEHRAWLRERVEEGVCVSAGAYADGSGALLLFALDAATDEDALRALLTEDPFVIEGLVEAVRVNVWKPAMGALSAPV